jgi:hypothetical protein
MKTEIETTVARIVELAQTPLVIERVTRSEHQGYRGAGLRTWVEATATGGGVEWRGAPGGGWETCIPVGAGSVTIRNGGIPVSPQRAERVVGWALAGYFARVDGASLAESRG